MPKRKHNEFKLTREIIALSKADNWDDAKEEWDLIEMWRSDEPTTCLCTHFPIHNQFLIENHESGIEAIVGSVCVQRFLEFDPSTIAKNLQRIEADPTQPLTRSMVDFLSDRELITDWEFKFLRDTARKRRLSTKQLAKRRDINLAILDSVMPVDHLTEIG